MYRDKNGVIEDSFQAFLVEGANYTDNEEYPILENWMISKTPPHKIMPFDKALHYRGDLSHIFVCFYSKDATFERVRRNPKRYREFFKKCAGIIGFDFSIHSDMPLAKQKAQINDNLSLSYYFGKQDIKIIPNIRYGIDETADEFLLAIPKHSLIAIGTHGFIKKNIQKTEWYCFLKKIIDVVEPTGIIVYGKLSGRIFDEFNSKCKFYYYEPWIYFDKRNRGGIQDGD